MNAVIYGSRTGSLSERRPDAHGKPVREVRPVGRTGGHLMRLEQGSGEWRGSAVPELAFRILAEGTPVIEFDVGYGLRKASLQKGAWCIKPPNAPTRIYAHDAHVVTVLSVPYDRLQRLVGDDLKLPADGDFGDRYTGPNYSPMVPALICRLWREAEVGGAVGALAADGILLQLTSAIIQDMQHAQLSLRGGLAPYKLRMVKDYLEAHMSEGVSLADLAALVELSVHHFCRAFKQSTGVPPHRWLTMLRMQRARELLLTTRLSVAEVAMRMGYANQSHFTVAFCKEFGATPSSLRRHG